MQFVLKDDKTVKVKLEERYGGVYIDVLMNGRHQSLGRLENGRLALHKLAIQPARDMGIEIDECRYIEVEYK